MKRVVSIKRGRATKRRFNAKKRRVNPYLIMAPHNNKRDIIVRLCLAHKGPHSLNHFALYLARAQMPMLTHQSAQPLFTKHRVLLVMRFGDPISVEQDNIASFEGRLS